MLNLTKKINQLIKCNRTMKKITNSFLFLFLGCCIAFGQGSIPDGAGSASGVTLDPATGICIDVVVDLSINPCPVGAALEITHTWTGDLSGYIVAGGETLALFTRPRSTVSGDADECAPGTCCGTSTDPPNTVIEFIDGGNDSEANPNEGLTNGPYDPATADCPGSVTSFADLCTALTANCDPAGANMVTFSICVTDHQTGDSGTLNSGRLIDGDPADGAACAAAPMGPEVPTMGEWGIIVLALFMLIVGLVAVFNRRKVLATEKS